MNCHGSNNYCTIIGELPYCLLPVIIVQVKVRLYWIKVLVGFGYFVSEDEVHCKEFNEVHTNEMINIADISC
jgi:hypothetical protein